MKIGIITILKVNNYGAELQAYATQAALKKYGYDAEIIDYLYYKNKRHIRTKLSKPLFPMPLKKTLAEFIYPIISGIKRLYNFKQTSSRENRFQIFHQKNTSFSETYRTIDSLYLNAINYDVYIAGSDQIWNPGTFSSLAPYFLDFAPEGKKRIAYASSFGVGIIPEYAREYYSTQLRKFHAIGVREENAVGLIKSLCGKESTWVLDPTLLLDKNEWRTVSSPVNNLPDQYILIYELTRCKYIKNLALHFSKMLNLPIVRICKDSVPEDKKTSVIQIADAGPGEFLTLFDKADLIITNSFHGTAFSINFNKNFYTVIPDRKNNNDRQKSILKLFGLKHLLLIENSAYPEQIPEIDFNTVNEILKTERDKSIIFLTNAINH